MIQDRVVVPHVHKQPLKSRKMADINYELVHRFISVLFYENICVSAYYLSFSHKTLKRNILDLMNSLLNKKRLQTKEKYCGFTCKFKEFQIIALRELCVILSMFSISSVFYSAYQLSIHSISLGYDLGVDPQSSKGTHPPTWGSRTLAWSRGQRSHYVPTGEWMKQGYEKGIINIRIP